MKKFITLVLLASVMVLGGCAGTTVAAQENNTGQAQPVEAASVSPAESAAVEAEDRSDWPEKITIVQMPNEQNPDAGERNDAFRQAVEDYIGIPVEELEGTEYAVGIEAMKSNNLDILLVSPMSYYQAKNVANAEPLVTTGTMGAQPYKTVFITKSDRDDINSINDLKDKTFAFVDPASSSGYMYPKAKLLVDLELEAEQLENPGYFFKTVAYSGKHDSSVMGVVNGDYDAAAVALATMTPMAEAGLFNMDDIKIVGETDIIPNACYVIRSTLPQSLKDKILEFYLQYDEPAYFETFYSDATTRFIQAYDSDYAVVDEMVKILKIEE